MRIKDGKWIRKAVCTLAVAAAVFFAADIEIRAEELPADIILSSGEDGSVLCDGEHKTYVTFKEGDTLTVMSSDETAFSGLYIIWDSPVKEWTLETEAGLRTCGENGFLHEYVELGEPAMAAVIHIPAGGAAVSDVRIFGEGELPGDVQRWNPPCTKADIMLVPAHADDEILFFGGIIPTYGVAGGAQIQVVYMTQFWNAEHVREHEKLDGLWASGLTNYPVCGNFDDLYSTDIEQARIQYDEETMVSYIVGQIRRFQPQVIVTHDFGGEYGHGFHQLTAEAVAKAVEAAADENAYPDSAAEYGAWDTPKSYHHLYGENEINLDLRVPIEEMGGRTALEIAAEAYKQHKSQQWCWFYVSDDYQYSCARFGLYHTTVGADTTDDMLENIKTYKVQQEELESMEAESREEESRIQESIRESVSEEESASLEESRRQESEEEARRSEEESLRREAEKEESIETVRDTVIVVILVFAAILLAFIGIRCFLSRKRNSPEK